MAFEFNEEIGLAIIKSVELTDEGQIFSHWDAVLDAANIREKRVNSYNLSIDRPFKADKEIIFIELKGSPLKPFPCRIFVVI